MSAYSLKTNQETNEQKNIFYLIKVFKYVDSLNKLIYNLSKIKLVEYNLMKSSLIVPESN